MFFETAGISMTTGITAGVILALSPIFSCICESVFLKEKSTFSKNIFLGIGIVGVIYIAANTNTSDGKNSVIGIIFVFLAVISGQMYAVFSRKSSKHFNTFEVTYITCALGAIVFNSINFVRHAVNGNLLHYFDPLFDINNLVGFLYLGILSTIVATAMNNYALSKVQVSSIAAFGGISTLTTIVADILLNGEKLYTFQIIGITLIFIRMVGASYLDIKKK
jgi:drug/metabolite transporter (DMT)-like permease